MKKIFKKSMSILIALVMMALMIPVASVTVSAGSVIESAISWALSIADDDSHGYSQLQNRRWGNPDYDCSTFVITAFANAGCDVEGATYTGNMRSVFESAGFTWIPKSQIDLSNSSQLVRGDILLNEANHTEIYIGNNQRVGAHTGTYDIYDRNSPGDNNGREISIYNYSNSSNWDGVLRYKDEPDDPIVNGMYYHGADDYSNFRPIIRFSNPDAVAGVNFALKYEGSDWHWYGGTYNGADAWYCDVLSSDLGSGEEIVCHCYVYGKNGSYIGYAFSQDPKVEELLYHGSSNNSDFRPVAKISNPDSVSEVKFAVKYEGGDWHWYNGDFNGANAWYCDVLSSDLGTGTTIVCHCYIYGKNGHTKGYALPELSLEKDSYPVVESWYFDGATDHSDFRPVIRLQNPETVSYVKFAVKYDGSDWHWYDGQFNGGNAWFCDVLSDDLGSGKTIICHGYVYANNGSYMGYPFSDLKLDKDYDNPIIEEWKYNIDHNNNSIHYQIKCENPETVSKVQFAVRTDNTEWIWHEGNFNDDKIWSIDIPIDNFDENDNVVCHCYVSGRNGSYNGYPFSEIKINEISRFAVGDTNLDEKITIGDVTAIQRHLAELEVFTDEQLSLADTNGDGEINISDATHLQMYLAEFDGIVLGKQ